MAVGSNPTPCTRKIGRAAECELLLTAWSERTRRFESSIFRHGRVTQLVECRSEKPMVTGSNPVPTTTAYSAEAPPDRCGECVGSGGLRRASSNVALPLCQAHRGLRGRHPMATSDCGVEYRQLSRLISCHMRVRIPSPRPAIIVRAFGWPCETPSWFRLGGRFFHCKSVLHRVTSQRVSGGFRGYRLEKRPDERACDLRLW